MVGVWLTWRLTAGVEYVKTELAWRADASEAREGKGG
jgi:hypothetical protein